VENQKAEHLVMKTRISMNTPRKDFACIAILQEETALNKKMNV
jgi:hypothetical protein